MSKCYIIHEPLRYDKHEGRMVPMFDLSAVEGFGEPVYILPKGVNPPSEPTDSQPYIRDAMRQYHCDDYIVAVGNIELVSWACALAAQAADGIVNILKWDNRTFEYNPICTRLW